MPPDSNGQTILVVDDEPHIRDVIRFALEKAGMRVVEAATGPAALAAFDPARIDLVVLDINLPGVDGLDVCRAIRRSATTPILFVSARDEEFDRILGLELGGDDYMTKPFSARELTARVGVILRRIKQPSPRAAGEAAVPPLVHGRLQLDTARHEVRWDDAGVVLTATEFQILKTLLERPTHVRDRDSLIRAAYDWNVHVSDRTIDSHIRHIRLKLQAVGAGRVIETLHGVGYKLGPCT
jgi:two-component system OmpR family response regulator